MAHRRADRSGGQHAFRVHLGLGDADLPEVAAVLSDAFAEYPVAISFTPETLEGICVADDVLLEACSLARDTEKHLLGICLAALRGDCGRLAAMGVVRGSHRRGVGRALGESALQSLRRAGARKVILEALTVNTPALALYETQLGFSRRRRLIGFTRQPGGEPIEQSRWDRALSASGEPDSWQLPGVIRVARMQADLIWVPAVVPEHHPVAELLQEAGFGRDEIDQYELERFL